VKFTIQKKVLVRLLKVVTPKAIGRKADHYLRIEAWNMRVNLSANQVEAEGPAMITKKGVCFIRYRNLLQVVNSFKGTKDLTVEIEPGGLRIGRFSISEGIWLALFDDPRKAPKSRIDEGDPALAKTAATGEALDVQAWRDFYSKGGRQ
jgi:hypothetical protein